jgi:flagellar hook-basal body complex protein FliE
LVFVLNDLCGIAKLWESDRRFIVMFPVSLKSVDLSKASELIHQADGWIGAAGSSSGADKSSSGSFEATMASEMAKVFGQSKEVDAAVVSFNAGGADSSIERTVFLMAKAEADLRLAVQVRNKAVTAYQEVMNMQI